MEKIRDKALDRIEDRTYTASTVKLGSPPWSDLRSRAAMRRIS